ncbi:LytTR family transcriptional regulator DNA-binding domain-containing protein [Haliscomenobacter sp.]|uniref:LytTR family transcriptional regulator DNA-binding domain-containing protein n=1 Tax=Haliscomenobacter sp. TaxID=2717303 RepID=UPI003BAB8406
MKLFLCCILLAVSSVVGNVFAQTELKPKLIDFYETAVREDSIPMDLLRREMTKNNDSCSTFINFIFSILEKLEQKQLELAEKHLKNADRFFKQLDKKNTWCYDTLGVKYKVKFEDLVQNKGYLEYLWAAYFFKKHLIAEGIQKLKYAKKIFLMKDKLIFERKNHFLGVITTYDIARALKLSGDFTESAKYFEEAQELLEEQYYFELAPPIYLKDIAELYRYINDFNAALFYHHREISRNVGLQDDTRLTQSYIEISKTFQKMNLHDSAFLYLNKALEIGQGKNKNPSADAYFAMGMYRFSINEYNPASFYLESALKLYTDDDKLERLNCLIGLCQMYLKNGNKEKVKSFFKVIESDRSLPSSKYYSDVLDLENLGAYYFIRSKVNDWNGNSEEAYKYLGLYTAVRDTLSYREKRHLSLIGRQVFDSKLNGGRPIEHPWDFNPNNVSTESLVVTPEKKSKSWNILFWGLPFALVIGYFFMKSWNGSSRDKAEAMEEDLIESETLLSDGIDQGSSNLPKESSVNRSIIEEFYDHAANNEIIVCSNNVKHEDILYYKKEDDYVSFVVNEYEKETKLLAFGTLIKYEKLLPYSYFLQVHRSYVVNIIHVLEWTDEHVRLKCNNDLIIKFTNKHRARAIEVLNNYIPDRKKRAF